MSPVMERLDRLEPLRRSYVLDTLATHLVAAGQIDRLHQLLARRDDRYTWASWHYKTKNNYSDFLEDLDLAWRAADEEGIHAGYLELRYALMSSSVVSESTKLPVSLILALVKSHMWTGEQGLIYLQQLSETREKFKALVKLGSILRHPSETKSSHQTWSECLRTISTFEHPHLQARALRKILSFLPTELLDQVIALSRSMTNVTWRSLCLSLTAHRLNDPLRREVLLEALSNAQQTKEHYWRVQSLVAAGSQLGKEGEPHLERAVEDAKKEEDLMFRSQLFGYLADDLPKSFLLSSWEYVRALPAWQRDRTGRWVAREHALDGYAPALAKFGLYDLAIEAVELMNDMNIVSESFLALAETARSLPPEYAPKITELAIKNLNETGRSKHETIAKMLSLATPYLNGSLLFETLSSAFNNIRIDPWELRRDVIWSELTDPPWPVRVVSALTPHIPKDLARRLLRLHLETRSNDTDPTLPEAAGLLTRLESCRKAVALTSETEKPLVQLEILIEVARNLPIKPRAKIGKEALRKAQGLEGTDIIDYIASVTEVLPEKLCTEVLSDLLMTSLASVIPDMEAQSRFFDALTRAWKRQRRLQRNGGEKQLSVQQEVEKSLPVNGVSGKGKPITEIEAQRLRRELATVKELSTEIYKYDTESERDMALDKLFPQLIEAGLFEEAADAALSRYGRYDSSRHGLFNSLLGAGAYELALEKFVQFGSPTEELTTYIPQMPEELLPTVLKVVKSVQSHRSRADALKALSRRSLTADLLTGMIDAAARLDDQQQRQEVFSTLSSNWLEWSESAPREAYKAWCRCLRLLAKRTRRQLFLDLASLSPIVAAFDRPVGKAREVVTEVIGSWP